MPGAQERVLRRRIKSVQATKKITRAMELIAASRIMRARARLDAAIPYSNAVENVLRGVMYENGDTANSDGSVLVCTIAADRGLCGGYNMSVLRAATHLFEEFRGSSKQFKVMAVGKKATSFFKFSGQELAASFMGFSDKPSYEDAVSIADSILELLDAGEIGEINLVSTRFKSAGSQAVEVRKILPVDTGAGKVSESGSGSASGSISESGSESGSASGESAEHSALERARNGYLELEPEPAELLPIAIRRYVESELFTALLEAATSEHSARQRAMAAATENADELTKTLTRAVNRARQDAITTEIMEIVGGAEALRQASSVD